MQRTHGAILRRHVQVLRSILESLSEGVIVANKTGRFILANRAARDFVGQAPEYVPPADRARTFGLHLPDGKALYPADELPLARAIRGVETAEGEVKQQLGPTGPPLGMFGDSPYTAGPELVLEPGELLVLLTDGVIEAETPEGEFFGVERALDVVTSHRGEPARVIADQLQRAVRRFTGTHSLRDDLTIVVCKRENAS
jgi:PAS domain-containing protein